MILPLTFNNQQITLFLIRKLLQLLCLIIKGSEKASEYDLRCGMAFLVRNYCNSQSKKETTKGDMKDICEVVSVLN